MTATNEIFSRFSATPEVLAFALECANDAVYIYDDARRICYANPRASMMTGYTNAELVLMSIGDLDPTYHFPDRATVLERARMGTRVLVESVHVLRDGREMPVEISLSVGVFAGRVFSTAFVRDISRRRTRQREQEQFRQIIDTSPVALVICERDNGAIRYVNQFAQRLFGTVQHVGLGNTVASLFASLGVESRFCERLASGEELENRELQLQVDGQNVWVSINSRNMLLDGSDSVCLAMMDVTEAHELSNQLSYQATYDELTGLLNRREFEDRLQEVIELTSEKQSENTLCYLDLDQFKVINDNCGHMAGDELLRQIGTELATCLRRDDTLARLGGDEFAMLLENCSLVNAERIANKVLQMLQAYRFVWEGKVFTIGASIGLTKLNAGGESLTEVLRRADAACYAAKEAGRNRVQVFLPDDVEFNQRHHEMQWVAQLNWAVDNNRFELWTQEIAEINHNTDTLSRDAGSHFEVLLRLRDADGLLVQPGKFLPAAERFDLAPKIDRWVIRNLFDWLTKNPEARKKISLCAINVSGQTLNDLNFQLDVISMLESSPLPPQSLCFEVTETSAIANLSAASAFMERLRQQGCKISLDDFGRGLSSFAYLKSLPVDFVKIDGFFVKDIITDPVDRAMVKAIIDMAHALGKKAIAEFVENDAILEQVIELGVDYVQGYGIARPVPLS